MNTDEHKSTSKLIFNEIFKTSIISCEYVEESVFANLTPIKINKRCRSRLF